VPLPDGARSTLRVHLPAAADAPRPALLLVHGLWVGPEVYEGTAQHLASRGYAVAMFDQWGRSSTDLPGWVGAGALALDALHAATARDGPLEGALDLSKIGVLGHSFGGMTALGLAATDARVGAAVALAPGATQREALLRYAATMRDVPVLVIAAELDDVSLPATFCRPAYHAIPHARKLYVEIAGANHLNFSDVSLPFGARIKGAQQRTIARRYANAWFDRFLLGDADAGGFTTGAFAAADDQLSLVSIPAPSEEVAGGARTGTVTAAELNVRAGPGTDHAALATLQAGARVTIVAERDGWVRVTFPGAPQGELWVRATYVREGP
jgi:predicted dienelactone hydrolase